MRQRRSGGRSRSARRDASSSASTAATPQFRRSSTGMILLAAAGALLLLWLVARLSVTLALGENSPQAAASWAPAMAEIRLAQAADELQLTGNPSAQTVETAFEAFRRMPLSDVPLLIGARRAMASAQDDIGDRLLAMAARRNPRSRYTLLLELDNHIRRGRTEEAAKTMGALTRFFPEVGDFLVAELGRMALDPASRDAVRGVMETDRQLRRSVLEQLARDGADPEMILALAGPQAPTAAGGEAPSWQRLLLDGMVARGQVVEALAVWSRLNGVDPEARSGGLYDPGFERLPGSPPFNWAFESGPNGFAEPVGSGRMSAQFYGRGNATLASQLLRLAPGSYRIELDAEGEADGENGRLTWVVSCQPGGQRLAEVALVGVDFAGKHLAADFSVPDAGCPGQWLRLVGTPAEFPQDQKVTVSGLRIAAAGGQ